LSFFEVNFFEGFENPVFKECVDGFHHVKISTVKSFLWIKVYRSVIGVSNSSIGTKMQRLIQNLRWSGIVVLGLTFAMCGVSLRRRQSKGPGRILDFRFWILD
jgi:hypothetical protein